MTDHAKLYALGHLAAAYTGESAFRAAADRYRNEPWGPELAQLRDDVAEDRRRLEEIAHRLGANADSVVQRASQAVLSIIGGATRMLHTRGGLGAVTEVEKLRDAVMGKLAGWDVLLVASGADDRLSRPDIEELIARAQDQADRLRALHAQVAQSVFDGAGLRTRGPGGEDGPAR